MILHKNLLFLRVSIVSTARCSSSRNSLRGITHSIHSPSQHFAQRRCYLQLWWYFCIFNIIYKYIFSPNSVWKRGPTWLCTRAGPSYLFPGKINIKKNIFFDNLSQKDIMITSLFWCLIWLFSRLLHHRALGSRLVWSSSFVFSLQQSSVVEGQAG